MRTLAMMVLYHPWSRSWILARINETILIHYQWERDVLNYTLKNYANKVVWPFFCVYCQFYLFCYVNTLSMRAGLLKLYPQIFRILMWCGLTLCLLSFLYWHSSATSRWVMFTLSVMLTSCVMCLKFPQHDSARR